MVAESRSENLNPWHWKFEQAPEHKNTAPNAQSSVNVFEKGEAHETQSVLTPSVSERTLENHRDIEAKSAQTLGMGPAAKSSVNIPTKADVTGNIGTPLKPLSHASPLVHPESLHCAENSLPALEPITSKDQLVGYEPKYFLKEDGKSSSEAK